MYRNSRKGFTLVELIFVIVIIGVLAAVAVPKFAGLKQNAEAASVIKVASDAYASIPSVYVNLVDLEGKPVTGISDLVDISGKGWDTTSDVNETTYKDGTSDVITLTLENNRTVTLLIDCSKFKDSSTQEKCHAKVGTSGTTTSSTTTSF